MRHYMLVVSSLDVERMCYFRRPCSPVDGSDGGCIHSSASMPCLVCVLSSLTFYEKIDDGLQCASC